MAIGNGSAGSNDPRTRANGSAAVQSASQRRLTVGSNVALTILLAAAIVVVLQWFGYEAAARGARRDMTMSGVNSLSDGTAHLLRSLDKDVTLTSLYFKTDLEDEDQQSYRRSMEDLLRLYASTNPGKVRFDWVNPVSDHEKVKKLMARLREKSKFKEELEPYRKCITTYQETLDGKMRALVQSELDALGAFSGPMMSPAVQQAVGQIEQLFNNWQTETEKARGQVDQLMNAENPQFAAAVGVLRSMYRDFAKSLKDVAGFGKAQAQKNADLPAEVIKYLSDAGSRYATLGADVERAQLDVQGLQPLKLDDLLQKLAPTANAALVETESEAIAVDFPSAWPMTDQNRGVSKARFKDHAFKGEQKVTAAILRATHKEQTAVVFVRYGGAPLLTGGMMLPGQRNPGGAYEAMKQQIEDANFVVDEWDLKSSTTPPTIEPKPTKTIYVVFKPTPQERNPMGQPADPKDPPFGEAHRKAITDAVEAGGRALFVGGWHPGPFGGGLPAGYEYTDYLKTTWGISFEHDTLLLQVVSVEPGKFSVNRDFANMRDLQLSDDPIVKDIHPKLLTLPWSVPLKFEDTLPDGVTFQKLATVPKRDTTWGIKNIATYQEQLNARDFLTRAEGDTLGPFDVAVTAAKGSAKLVLISGRDFAVDDIALAMVPAVTAQGFTLLPRNQGNVALLVNSLHWLNDNTEIMNVGQPVNASVLNIKGEGTVTAIRALTIFAWPALALCCGGVAWWVRRR